MGINDVALETGPMKFREDGHTNGYSDYDGTAGNTKEYVTLIELGPHQVTLTHTGGWGYPDGAPAPAEPPQGGPIFDALDRTKWYKVTVTEVAAP